MCQATIYLDEEKVMKDVIWVEPVAEGVLIRTFFADPVVVKGVIKGIDLLKHRVLLASPEKTEVALKQMKIANRFFGELPLNGYNRSQSKQ